LGWILASLVSGSRPRSDWRLIGAFLLDLLSTSEIVYDIIGAVNRKRIRFTENTKMAKKKSRLGGHREGSGRKLIHPEGETTPVTVRVPKTLIAQLDAIAEKQEQSRSEIVSEAIRGFLDAQ